MKILKITDFSCITGGEVTCIRYYIPRNLGRDRIYEDAGPDLRLAFFKNAQEVSLKGEVHPASRGPFVSDDSTLSLDEQLSLGGVVQIDLGMSDRNGWSTLYIDIYQDLY
ncbi:MAG: hypothetical protein FJ161_04495 [Gammaproteobacteria bacterium]|nr:hypothetical protein [Gammaproteobacteria bacterium]